MENYTVVRTDNLAGIVDGSKLRSVRFYNDGEVAAIENGAVVSIEGIEEGTRDIRKAVAPTANQKLGALALIASPEIVYESTYAGLNEFVNEAGEAALAYILCSNDEFSVTAEGFDGAPKVDAYVGAGADTKWKVLDDKTDAIGKIIAVEAEGGYTYYVIHIN